MRFYLSLVQRRTEMSSFSTMSISKTIAATTRRDNFARMYTWFNHNEPAASGTWHWYPVQPVNHVALQIAILGFEALRLNVPYFFAKHPSLWRLFLLSYLYFMGIFFCTIYIFIICFASYLLLMHFRIKKFVNINLFYKSSIICILHFRMWNIDYNCSSSLRKFHTRAIPRDV